VSGVLLVLLLGVIIRFALSTNPPSPLPPPPSASVFQPAVIKANVVGTAVLATTIPNWLQPIFSGQALSAANYPPVRISHVRNMSARTAHASRASKWLLALLGAAIVAAVFYALVHVCIILAGLDRGEMARVGVGLLGSFVRVNIALLLGAAWTIPAGVAIGFSPRLARIAQPLAQIAASVPATALFPVVLLVLIRLGGGLGTASIVLLLLGTQWYILFNVIAGAIAIPTDLKEAAKVFRFGAAEKWRKLIVPGIFPYLVTGLVTASGGAWNASIIAEYFHFKGQTFSTTGLGATISHASDSGNFNLLLVATIVMALVVVTINRLLWGPLHRLAETRFRLEG
jgi:NitT/TauT family transport system permease protein